MNLFTCAKAAFWKIFSWSGLMHCLGILVGLAVVLGVSYIIALLGDRFPRTFRVIAKVAFGLYIAVMIAALIMLIGCSGETPCR